MKKITILLLLLNIVVGYSQILVKKTDLKKSSFNKISNIYVDENNMYYTKLLDEKYDKNSYSFNRKYAFSINEGKEINLIANESVISIKKNNLYTAIEDVEKSEKIYVVSAIDKAGVMSKKAELKLSLTSSAKVLKNGNIIMTEGGHGGTDWVALYSKNLKLIHQFRPFNGVFELINHANENYIVYVAQKEKNSQLRVGLYSYLGNKALIGSKEIEIDSNYVISSTKIEGTKILLLLSSLINSQSKIIILNNELNILNELTFESRVSNNKLVSSNNTIYLNFPTKIKAYDINSKNLLWEISKLNTSITKLDKGFKFKGSELNIIDDKLILLEGTYADGKTEIENIEVKVLSIEDGKLKQTIKLGNSDNELKPTIYKKALFLIQNGKAIIYEKK